MDTIENRLVTKAIDAFSMAIELYNKPIINIGSKDLVSLYVMHGS